MNPIGLAIPFFLALMGAELLIARIQGRRLYRLNDTLTDLACGIGDQTLALVFGGFFFGLYIGVYEAFRVVQWDATSVATWVVAIVGKDFLYYWYHRFSHRTHLGWATHVVHHQSEEYNLAVALRQSWFTKAYAWSFYIPLAVLGIPPAVYALASAINLLYQFWIHTQVIERLGPIEWVFNTPSHHRVHHGTNLAYLDRNYAGMLIIWDRMFGTFAAEDEPAVYGTLAPVRSWNPLWVNVQPLLKMLEHSASMKSRFDRWTAWLRPPGYVGDGREVTPDPKQVTGRGYDAHAMRSRPGYLVLQFAFASAALTLLLLIGEDWPSSEKSVVAMMILWTVTAWGALLEGRNWATWFDALRYPALLGIAAYFAATSLGLSVFAVGAVVAGLPGLIQNGIASRRTQTVELKSDART